MRGGFRRRGLAVIGAVATLAACSDDRATLTTQAPRGGAAGGTVLGEADVSDTGTTDDATIVVDDAGAGAAFDRRLLGVNVPAWVGPQRLSDPAFIELTRELGASVVRMPGGSWSSSYDWSGCQLGDDETCFWTWAARPSDYLGYLEATGTQGMWTVSFNTTAQDAAALVAFFNGEVGDERPIGIDRNGRDWLTVGHWARLRAESGHPDPAGIRLFEIGNEVYGGSVAAAGDDCVPWGWEDVWTCDGTEYVEGDDTHDGLIDFVRAMRAVDPTIQIGAVGVSAPEEWGGFGDEVIAGAAGSFDFYVVHQYGFDDSPSFADMFDRPEELWPTTATSVREALTAAGLDVPLALTEYNLVAFQEGDTDRRMTSAANALYLAEMIGAMAESGVAMANVWNLANGKAANGTDYGLVDIDSYERLPGFTALQLWSDFGTELLTVDGRSTLPEGVSLHVGRTGDELTILVVNQSDEAQTVALRTTSGAALAPTRRTSAVAQDLESPSLELRTVSLGGAATGRLVETVAAFSIVLVRTTLTS